MAGLVGHDGVDLVLKGFYHSICVSKLVLAFVLATDVDLA